MKKKRATKSKTLEAGWKMEENPHLSYRMSSCYYSSLLCSESEYIISAAAAAAAVQSNEEKMLSRRAIPSKKKEGSDDRSLDNLEIAMSPSHYESSPEEDFGDTSKKSSPQLLSRAKRMSLLKNVVTWGSLLYAGYLIGLKSSNNNNTPPSKKSNHHIPASNKWLLEKPPTLKQMYEIRNCESYLATYDSDGKRIDSKTLPIYTDEQWAYFYKVWKDQGGTDPSKEYKEGDRRLSKAPPDLVSPFKAGQTSDGKGRGLFATRDIKKGEMTYGSTKNYIFFTTGHDYRRFLDVFDDQTACDIMKFTWPQRGVGELLFVYICVWRLFVMTTI